VASSNLSLEAAAREAERRGIRAVILSDAVEGESREIARMHAALALQAQRHGRPFPVPVVLLSGGETTVTRRTREGQGGRNGEFALGFALAIAGSSGIILLAADTDGIDGSGDNAGAFADGSTVSRILARGKNPADLLSRNLSYPALAAVEA